MSPTARELQVLVALVEHGSAKDAARALGLSLSTVKDHVQSLYRRIDAYDRTHAVWLLWPILRDRYRLPNDRFGHRYERRVADRRAA